jgi:ABC-2 type transport system ATP-binding protein
LERVGLGIAGDRKVGGYSLGMRQRLGLAAALLGSPRLLVLDEPTNGLDPQGTREVRELIPELAAEGRTVMLCSHLLHEVEQVCDAVAIFQRGRVIAQGTTAELIGQRSQLEVRAADTAAALHALDGSPWASRAAPRDGLIRIDGAGDDGEAVNRWLAQRSVFASVIRPVRQGLEDVFFELTGDESHD